MSVSAEQHRSWEGRGSYKERADCAVRAVAAVLDVPYAEAHAMCAKWGRKPRTQFPFRKVVSGLGLELRGDLSCMSVGKALEQIGPGRYFVRISKHVFAVIDGMAFDAIPINPNARVKMVYKYEADMDHKR